MEDRIAQVEHASVSQSWPVIHKGKPYNLQYEDGFLIWNLSTTHKSDATSASSRKTPLSSRKINLRHTLSVSLDGTKQGFTINFIDIKPKFLWRRASQNFTSSDTSCENIVAFIQNLINQVKARPRKLLVYVNPCSGKCNGVSVHKKFVEPIFKLANIEFETLVTTHGGHIKEHLESVNLTECDGVVVVGGDGTFTEAFDALVRRHAKECGLDLIRDPTVQLKQVPLRLGIVPAGTGQGMVHAAAGTCDPETAVLHILTGYSSSLDGICAHNGNKLMGVGSMLFGYGFFGDIIKMSEDNRQYGRLRYLYAMVKGMVKYRTVDVEVSYLKCPSIYESNSQDINDTSGGGDNLEVESGATSDELSWIQANDTYKGVSGFLIDTYLHYPHSLALQLARDTTSRTKFVKELIKLRKSFVDVMTNPDREGKVESSGSDSRASKSGTSSSSSSNERSDSSKSGNSGTNSVNEWNIPAKAVRIKLKSHTVESLSQLSSEAREVMNVDGEAFTLTHPEVEIRVHADVMQMFGLGFRELKKPEWYGKKPK